MCEEPGCTSTDDVVWPLNGRFHGMCRSCRILFGPLDSVIASYWTHRAGE